MTDRPTILATAPLRGPGLDILRSLGDVIEDPWITESSMRLYNAEQLAARIDETGATIVICEADKCAGPVLDSGLVAIASTRGDPTNVDIAGCDRSPDPRAACSGAQRRCGRRDDRRAPDGRQPSRAARRRRRAGRRGVP